MRIWMANLASLGCRFAKTFAVAAAFLTLGAAAAFAQPSSEVGGEANLKLPDLSQVQFLGVDGHRLLLFGILFCVLDCFSGSPFTLARKTCQWPAPCGRFPE